MVIYCCAYGCKESFVKGGTVTFHSFPKDVNRRKIWEAKLRRENFKVTDSTRICSKHFKAECFDRTKFGGTWLKQDAIPTIFNFPEHLLHKQIERKSPMKRICVAETSVSQDEDSVKRKGLKRKFYLGDFTESDMTSPTKARKVLEVAQKNQKDQNKVIKNLRKQNNRMKRKINSLKELLSEMKSKNLISDSASDVLELSLPEGAKELIKRVAEGKPREQYPPQLRAFALTLHFYSAKAYDYVRKTFDCNLPDPSTLRRWYKCIDGSPGFTSEAFAALKVKAENASKKNSSVKGCLIIDEMAIRSHVEWDKNKFSGYIDLGTNIDDDQLPRAKESLTFMVNCINGNWKVPIGYFLINGLSSLERSNLITEALQRVHETGVDIVCLTFDGISTNIATANTLGANLSPDNLVHYFPHPVTGKPVYIILDACHMLKLVRNALASKGVIFDGNGNAIKWGYITNLENFQREEGLHAATKVRKRHIEWFREKMKVKLAAQVLSKSVADALKYLSVDLKEPDFQNCEATINFVTLFNNLFDILNSKNLLSEGFKAPFQSKNKAHFIDFLNTAEQYIENLKISSNGGSILYSNRKTGFLGFIICIKSIKSLYYSLCEDKNSPMNFLLTYKLSQDHLEMFFSSIRSKGGYNNNPTAKQYKAAYVRLLAHHEILTSDNANCVILDTTNILNLNSARNMYLNNVNANHIDENDIADMENLQAISSDHTYAYKSLSFSKLSEYVSDVVSHIAGFIVKKLKQTLKCPECYSAATESSQTNLSKLSLRKNRGGLSFPCESVIKICKIGEKTFRTAQASGKLLRNNVMHLLIAHGLREIMSNSPDIFLNLISHSLDQAPLENHRISLIKAILFEYYKIRLHHAGKLITEQFQTNKVRNLNLKATLFKGQ